MREDTIKIKLLSFCVENTGFQFQNKYTIHAYMIFNYASF